MVQKLTSSIPPFLWDKENLFLLDQRQLPFKKYYYKCSSYKDVVKCIKDMVVRGAPVIGLVSGWGIVLAVKEAKKKNLKQESFVRFIKKVVAEFKSSRPTAYNLFYIIEKLQKLILANVNLGLEKIYNLIIEEVKNCEQENYQSMLKIVKFGVELLKKNSVVLTHCNTGVLACGAVGTALGIIIEGYKKGKVKHVYVDETRPYLQGARLTMFELISNGVPCSLITDNMAAYVVKEKQVNYIITGADRIAKNGDTANKIGTYNLAIIAKYHNIPFYIAAPSSSIDTKIANGSQIKLEQRSDKEVKYVNSKLITLKDADVLHPAFDITPAELITAIITEKGIFSYPYNF